MRSSSGSPTTAGWSIAIAPSTESTASLATRAPSCSVRSGSPRRSRWPIRLIEPGRYSSGLLRSPMISACSQKRSIHRLGSYSATSRRPLVTSAWSMLPGQSRKPNAERSPDHVLSSRMSSARPGQPCREASLTLPHCMKTKSPHTGVARVPATPAVRRTGRSLHDEPGVELYALHEGPDRLVMIEKYESEQARSEHSKGAPSPTCWRLWTASSAAILTRSSSYPTRRKRAEGCALTALR
jgi:hypothetical protein